MALIDVLLDGLIDFAGLYPPASLEMQPMVDRYAAALAGPEAWMTGRVIVPAGGLDAFALAAQQHLVAEALEDPWCVSVLVGMNQLSADLDAIDAFNEAHEDAALVDVIEVKAADASHIETLAQHLPDTLFAFVEIAIDSDPRGLLAALAGEGMAAKIRTGGVTPDAYPAWDDVASFLVHTAAAQVPFKATAGLHHPLPNDNPDVPARQLGFLNVFLAAALAQHRHLNAAAVLEVLELSDPDAFAFDGPVARIGDHELNAVELEASRLANCSSFGSCSLDDPWDDLHAMGALSSPAESESEL